jgi:F-type H+-transporting ATPase subunit gamma
MPTLIDFRRRIRSVKNTQQITRAMKFVAAAKLRRAQENMLAARPYARQMTSLLASAMSRIENPQHPLLARRPEERILVISLAGDKGLCGAFNTNVLRRTLEFAREHAAQQLQVIAVGKKSRDSLRKRKAPVIADHTGIFQKLRFEQGKEVAGKVIELYAQGQIDAVYLIYNEFKSVLAQRLTVQRILPLATEEIAAAPAQAAEGHVAGHALGARVDYIYEQPAEDILGKLLPRYVETQVWRAMLETWAAFNAAQMTAMEAATKNAGELIDSLTLHMNKVRQAAITKEIIEVVSGAAAAQ